uniref:RNA helicase n=1 Tax=Pseudonaja textilis TaxID=8673 RepID=A0A670YVS0_PSETE
MGLTIWFRNASQHFCVLLLCPMHFWFALTLALSNNCLLNSTGPKTYSFGSAVDSNASTDESILKVIINSNLEKRIIAIINEHKKQTGEKGMISRRLTAKKLQDVYMALQGFSFKTEDIEEAMNNTILYGGDLHSALDWLCLNLSDDALPEGFSQQFGEEQQKTRARFRSPLPKSETPQVLNNTKKEDDGEKKATTEKQKSISMKERILLYAEQQRIEEENESLKNLEEEKFDPNERYLHLAEKLVEMKELAKSSKEEKNKQGQKMAQEKIRRFQQEMATLEDHPLFNPEIKVTDQPSEKKKNPVFLETDGALSLKTLEKSQNPPPEEQKVKKKDPQDVRNFDYTARSWTGKSPKQFLIDWVRKHYSKSPNPSFEKVPSGRYWKCRVRVIKSADDTLVVCPTIVTEDSMQAQHLAATLALYHLTKGQNSLCGYQIRMESRTGEATRLLYCTTGVLLRKLQDDVLLSDVSHVIVDEVHERSVQSDFLLIILREILHKRSDLHLILMSATVDSEKFSSYFTHCPILRISGRSYPVEVFHVEDVIEETGFVLEKDSEYCQKFLEEEEEITVNVTSKGGGITKYQESVPVQVATGVELGPYFQKYSSRTREAIYCMNPYKINFDLILELLAFLDKSPQFKNMEGAVLIFLPGLAHIQQLYDLIFTDRRFDLRKRHQLIALHSVLSTQEQASAFTLPPLGVRKIVLATNIAETGITIPDVVFVIDTGRTKENRYHESSQMSSLEETFVSKASALQRQGRAGRVRDGFCFRLYTQDRFESFLEYSVPEILRVPLEELCLHIMKCNLGSPEEFLSKALDPPQPQIVAKAMYLLRKIGACELSEPKLTPLGQHLAALPVNVKIGKMLIFGAIFGCLDPVATLAAVMTEKSPFTTPIGRKDEADLAKSFLALASSDHLTIYKAYLGWKKARSEGGYRAEMTYCRSNFLNRTSLLTLEDVKQELIRVVQTAGFAAPSSRHEGIHSLSLQEMVLLKAVLTAGLYDNVGKIMYTKSVDVTEKLACMVETAQGKAQVHPSSVNRDLQTYGWLLYQEKIRYARVFLKETTLISPFPILLFGGDIEILHRERLLSVDGWIHFQAPVKIAVIFKQLRVLIESVLKQKLENPKMSLEDDKILNIIKELIKTENTI